VSVIRHLAMELPPTIAARDQRKALKIKDSSVKRSGVVYTVDHLVHAYVIEVCGGWKTLDIVYIGCRLVCSLSDVTDMTSRI